MTVRVIMLMLFVTTFALGIRQALSSVRCSACTVVDLRGTLNPELQLWGFQALEPCRPEENLLLCGSECMTLKTSLRSPPAAGVIYELNVTATGCSDSLFSSCDTVINLYSAVFGSTDLSEFLDCAVQTCKGDLCNIGVATSRGISDSVLLLNNFIILGLGLTVTLKMS